MNVMQIVKDNPIPIGIGVVILLVLITASKGANPNGVANAASALQAQSIAANSNAEIAGLNANVTIATGAQTVENNRIAQQAALGRMSVVGELFSVMTGANAQVSMNNGNNLLKSTQALYAKTLNLAAIEADLSKNRDNIAGGIKANADKLNAQANMIASDNNFKLAAIGAETQGNLSLLKERGAIELGMLKESGAQGMAALAANLGFQSNMVDKNISTLPALLQHQQSLAKMQGDFAYGQTLLKTEAERKMASANAKAKNAETGTNVIKDVLSIFGF